MHLPDPLTAIEETLCAFDEVIREGKVRYIGCSNFSTEQLQEAKQKSLDNNLPVFITTQTRYNLLDRAIENELVETCIELGTGIIPWGALAGGLLTGKYHTEEPASADCRLVTQSPLSNPYRDIPYEANRRKIYQLRKFAESNHYTLAELALSWLLSKPYVSTVLFGATSPKQVTENLGAVRWSLTAAEIAEVERIVPK
jgi:aryl-alcohol dehydrogenase-like predicted oxidoreductase